MSAPVPPPGGDAPRPRGSHRAEVASQSRSLLLPLLGVLAVLAALALAGYMVLTSGDDNPGATGNPVVTTPTSSASSTPRDTSSPSATPTHSKQQTGQPTEQPSKTPTKQPTKQPTHQASAQSVPQIPVYVFNQTTISGLAAQVASELESQGWNVVGVDNWRGFVPEDTVYYYPGDQAAANQLSKSLPEIGRVWPATSPMPSHSLTVILATTARK
ncbi:MAG TPA: LytR C-terminal domain-containing protein [Actinomycetes bacterium]|nr:LytR C-terminal domain-containing protein [Actinomycetes bacterium]